MLQRQLSRSEGSGLVTYGSTLLFFLSSSIIIYQNLRGPKASPRCTRVFRQVRADVVWGAPAHRVAYPPMWVWEL